MDSVDEIASLTPPLEGRSGCANTAILGMAVVYEIVLFELDRTTIDPGPQDTLRVAQKEIERI
ncbi:MAG: hypothetical protein P8182_16675 [Deltaproteobacteria bacterium]